MRLTATAPTRHTERFGMDRDLHMPRATTGDIFDCAQTTDLLLVFGHRGFATISVHCDMFMRQHGGLRSDPWAEPQPLQFGGKWVWFASDHPAVGHRGVPVSSLCETMVRSVQWAHAHGLKSLATNGYNAQNAHNPDIRASLLLCLGRELELDYGILIEFRNLSDVFVRNIERFADAF
jgi:hypothetical protein